VRAGNTLASKDGAAPPARQAKAKQGVQVISRAANVLRALEGEKQGLSLAQIAQRVGLARSTVQRIVDALSEEHFLIAATPTSGVRLGPALTRLAESARVEFDDITRPLLIELSQSVGETVDLSVLKNQGAVFTDQVQGAHRLRAVSHVGETFPLHCTANGKALLSVAESRRLERFLREKRRAHGRDFSRGYGLHRPDRPGHSDLDSRTHDPLQAPEGAIGRGDSQDPRADAGSTGTVHLVQWCVTVR
jgi:DNA-binding Lrp family transcriptional regulator